ncbi:MAG: ABC transporter ATP-binding protein [Lachnospiraceae bacterium]|nr:ABC transporter ATP-binding protein [Lachnospiraceae bacterium]
MLNILRKFFDFVGEKNKKKFQVSIVLSIFQALSAAMKIPAIMLVLQAMIEERLTGTVILQALAIMLGGLLVENAVKYKATMLQTEGGYDGAAFKRIEIAEHLRYLPMGYFNQNSLGSITSVTTNTMEHLADIGTRAVMLSTSGLIDTGVILLLVLIYDWRIGLVGILGTALFLIMNAYMQGKSTAAAADKVECDRVLVSQIMEYLQGIAEVKSYNLFGKTTKKLNDAIDRARAAVTAAEVTFMPHITVQNIVCKLTGAAMMLCSVLLFLNGKMELLICIGMSVCAFMIFQSLELAGAFSSLLRMIDFCVDKGQEIMDIPGMDIDGKDITPAHYGIELKDVTFSYEKRKIIDGISLKIPEKTTTAIVGPSGGGKTTLCSLIARFWDLDSGSVTLDGRDVREYSVDSLMKNFSFVFQNVYLFSDTIANNIRFGKENASMDEVILAAKKACCHDFIMELPEGYNTVIGEGGATLSGGEKQRISIARAIMKDSPIIILDEATANVDPENEKELVDAIESLTKEKTIIMIAHRLKTVRSADQIVVVNHGRIEQLGKHEELMQQDGIYRRFVSARELAAGWKLNSNL